mgnify:CR=1 FL=1
MIEAAGYRCPKEGHESFISFLFPLRNPVICLNAQISEAEQYLVRVVLGQIGWKHSLKKQFLANTWIIVFELRVIRALNPF